MPRHIRLPAALLEHPFAVHRAVSLGISEDRLTGDDLVRPFRGVRASPGQIRTIEDLCLAYTRRMPDHQFFSHTTAARLWQIPLPSRFSPTEPVHVCSTTRDRVRCVGAVGHQPRDRHIGVRQLNSLRATDPETTWCHLAALLALDDLIVAADAFIYRPRYADHSKPAPQPYSTPDRLAHRLRQYRGPGRMKLIEAIGLMRQGSASATETRLRLLLGRAGLPDPVLNIDIVDDRGDFVACGDLYYPAWRVLVEYDGDQHRTSTTVYENDMVRSERLADTGVKYIRIRKAGLAEHRARTIDTVRAALRQAGWRP